MSIGKSVKIAISGSLDKDEKEFIERINAERTSRGLNALTVNLMLIQVARAHSDEMCKLNYFDHHSPTAGMWTPMNRYFDALYRSGASTPEYALVGENIYYCSAMSKHYNIFFAHEALMNSPSHRKNILDPRFTELGVGTFRSVQGRFWGTEVFLRNTAPTRNIATRAHRHDVDAQWSGGDAASSNRITLRNTPNGI